MKIVSYQGWQSCVELSNTAVDLVLLADVGPRIIRFGFRGGANELREFPDLSEHGMTHLWHVRGGHRLWHAPEDLARTYVPDNDRVKVTGLGTGVRAVQPVEKATGIRKEMEVSLLGERPSARVLHRLVNEGPWPVELAPWAPTLLERGGRAIVALPPRGVHPTDCAPTATIALWPYTDMSDPRFFWGSRYVMVRQDPAEGVTPQKIGVSTDAGWCAYWRGGHLFVKSFAHQHDRRYPELNSPVTVFTNSDSMELETLGPLVIVAPGGSVQYTETWSLFADVPEPKDEAAVDASIAPLALQGGFIK
jgi:hypothetical protein